MGAGLPVLLIGGGTYWIVRWKKGQARFHDGPCQRIARCFFPRGQASPTTCGCGEIPPLKLKHPRHLLTFARHHRGSGSGLKRSPAGSGKRHMRRDSGGLNDRHCVGRMALPHPPIRRTRTSDATATLQEATCLPGVPGWQGQRLEIA
jgi:hypothetical protein